MACINAATGVRLPWIELCQAISVDPHELVVSHLQRVLDIVLEASRVNYLVLLDSCGDTDVFDRVHRLALSRPAIVPSLP